MYFPYEPYRKATRSASSLLLELISENKRGRRRGTLSELLLKMKRPSISLSFKKSYFAELKLTRCVGFR